MAVQLGQIRDLLLPGLMEIRQTYATFPAWEHLFDEGLVVQQLPLPMISPQAVLAMGAAAAVIKNPVITRRFFKW